MHEKHTWLTSVLTEDAVENALVLAESLRQSQTSKRIAVITSNEVSAPARKILRKTFDQVVLIDNSLVPQLNGQLEDVHLQSRIVDLQAKIFAFSLESFDKCVFLGANTFVLENIDRLFDVSDLQFYNLEDEIGHDLDLFLFRPCLELCEYLVFKMEQAKSFPGEKNGVVPIYRMIDEFLENNKLEAQVDPKFAKPSISYFSVKSGQRKLNGSTPEVVRFVDVDHSKGSTKEQLFQLNKTNLALGEKAILSCWRNINEQCISRVLTNPLAQVKRKSNSQSEPIAIVGMSCRLPGANNLEEFWNLLYAGEEGVRTPPDFRWKKEHSLFASSEKERSTTNAGFLSVPVDEFDSKFFGISPKDAEFLDPQARLLHEVMWEALENAGIDPLGLKGSHTGIFTGSWMNDYKDILQGTQEREFYRTYMGNGIGATAARLSFLLGLTGPNIATESGCSSAIVAVDLAVKSLRNRETNLSMAGGVNLFLHPFLTTFMDQVIAPDGRCKTFDAKANGFGRAEGCGVLVLKRLSDALKDRDHVWAVIKGSALSQEGLSRSLGTPTIHCESLAMELALKDAGIQPEQVSFVETHGTGTSVGDPMEIGAIKKAYYSENRKEPLIIGSVKTNVGHTESCSGITGIIKTVLAMQHELIPKHLNFDTLNEEIDLDGIPAKIPVDPIPWPKINGQPRVAGVSSFGITGTDGHVIVEEMQDANSQRFILTEMERPLHFVKVSAKTPEALEDLLNLYKNCFEKEENVAFSDLAYTANVGRASFSHRAFLLAQDHQKAIEIIKSDKLARSDTGGKEQGKVCFLFTGQGSQYSGMAKTLYETSPVFRLHFDQCDKILKEKYNLRISDALWNTKDGKELSRTIYSQTSIFCVEYCLLKLWNSWGIKPDYVLGHSLGEFCAAVAAGILTFEDALMLVAERSRLIDNLPRGSMLVIKADFSTVDKLMKQKRIDLDYAAVNSQDQTVVAGNTDKITEFLNICKGEGLKAIILDATHAFHSRHMNPMLEAYRKVAETVKFSKASTSCQYISGMEGKLLENLALEMNADYWVRHTRDKVSFLDASLELKKLDCQHFIEIGPQPVLCTFISQNFDDTPVSCFSSLRRNTNEWETIMTSLGKLYLEGFKIDWEGFDKPYARKKVPDLLPIHPFHRKSFWVDCSASSVMPIHPLIGSSYKNASNVSIFQNNLDLKVVPWIKDHCVGNRIILPGAGFAEMCLVAGYCVANSLTETLELPQRPMALKNLKIEAPLELIENRRSRLQVIVDLIKNDNLEESASEFDQQEDFAFRVKIFRQNMALKESTGNWVQHATSTFCPIANTRDFLENVWNKDRVKNILDTSKPLNLAKFYKRIDSVGLRFGELFQSLQRYWGEENQNEEIVAETKIPSDHGQYLIHPIIIDAMIQAVILSTWRTQSEALSLPVQVGKLVWLDNISEESSSLYLHAWWDNQECTVVAVNSDLKPIAYMNNVQLVQTTVRTVESVLEQQTRTVPDCWHEVWKPVIGPNENRIVVPELEPIFVCEEFKDKVDDISLLEDVDWVHAKQSNRLINLYITKALLQLGWDYKVGDKFTVEDFCETFKVLPIYRQLMHFYLIVVQNENGMLEFIQKDNCWKVKSQLPSLKELEEEAKQLAESLQRVPRQAITTKIFEHLGANMYKTLKGEEPALQLLFPTDPDKQHLSADAFYHNHPGRENTFAKILNAVEIIINRIRESNQDNSKTVLRILEVGAGTGNLTIEFLNKLKQIWGTRFEFWFTDISAAFFAKAEKKFEEFKDNFKFTVFNVEDNALEQGIPLNYFDWVIAQDVLHATKNLEESVGNLRQTLRSNGCLMFTETLTQDPGITFLFGLLEGYWRFTDYHWRPTHTCVDGPTWSKVLKMSGFGYVRVIDGYMGTLGIVTGQNTMEPGKIGRGVPTSHDWILFGNPNSVLHRKLVEKLKDDGVTKLTVVVPEKDRKDVGTWSRDVSIQYYSESDSESAAEIIRVLGKESMHAIIYAWGEDSDCQEDIALPFLHLVKHLLSLKRPPKLYVLTSGVHRVIENFLPSHPSQSTLYGMSKTLKNENIEFFVRYIDLAEDAELDTLTDQILFELAINKEKREKERLQIAYRENIRYEPRFNRGPIQQGDELKLPPSTSRYQLVLPESKLISDLTFDSLEDEPVKENEVEVAIKAYSLNFRDILTIIKPTEQFENHNNVGLDFSGVVTKLGEKVAQEGKLKVGDHICGLNLKDARFPSHITINADNTMKLPDHLTFSEAAALPAVVATSVHCLVEVAKLKKGETILIHTGSGGVGLTAIQVAKNIGANVVTTAGSPRKREYLRKNLGIEHVFHSRDTSYQEEIMKVTKGRGVNVVLNSITGPGFKEATLAVCAKNARFIEMSKLSVWTEAEVRERRPDVEYTIVDLLALDPSEWHKMINVISQHLNDGRVKQIPVTQFDALRLRQALQYFQKARHIGKVVVTMPEVKTKEGQWNIVRPLFNAQSTYIITGGLGGIGFEVCKWMLAKGATDIVLIGRNPPKPEVAREIEKLRKKYNVIVKLRDVGNFEQCKEIVEWIRENNPGKPIRGIQHCAGVLRDNLYDNQTWKAFEETYNPKVKGTWNLHHLTRHCPLEHFILYSSITALAGTPAQANHASANCFEDAFAHYRYALGLPAISINWGQWAQVGCAKDINLPGIMPVTVQRMLNGLESAIRSHNVQVAYCDFDSLHALSIMSPTFKFYLDKSLMLKISKDSKLESHLLKSDQFWKDVDEAPDKAEKMEVTMNYMKIILRGALRMDPDEPISVDANMSELGVDSLMFLELKNSIQSLLGSRITVTANMLKDCQTIRDLATILVSKICDDEVDFAKVPALTAEEFSQILESDCQLEESIRATEQPPVKSVAEIKTILITGVTGQLGPYILACLSQPKYKSLEKIICLIRSSKTQSAEERLRKTLAEMNLMEEVDLSRIVCVGGELTEANFGLPEEEYGNLCNTADAVFHLAVKSNHVENYRKYETGSRDVRSVNVGGTLNVLRFASTGKTKHVFFASSLLAVFGGNDEGYLCDDWPELSQIEIIANHGVMGYPTSKFVCEMLLKQANQRGIPCKAFRYPWIMGHSKTGQLNYANNHYILRMISYLKINAMPDAALPSLVLPVDVCADLGVRMFWNDQAPNEVYNIAPAYPELEVEFRKIAKEDYGKDLELVNWRSPGFVEKLYATDMPMETLKELYQNIDKFIHIAATDAFRAVSGYLQAPKTFFRNKKLQTFIPGFEKEFPSTMEIIRKNLEFVRAEGFLKRFGVE